MSETVFVEKESALSLERLLPRLEARFQHRVGAEEWETFVNHRVRRHFGRLFRMLHRLYGDKYDFFYHLEDILTTAIRMWADRSPGLKAQDASREADPQWFQSHRMIGATCYVDLFAGDLSGLREKLPYLSELGITYLHLMPLFRSPEGDNDGGYSISSYREVDPKLGTMDELRDLATELRHHGISLCVDFVFNHTSDEHEWARRALDGKPEFQAYYRMFPDREMPDQYEKTLRAVFPDEHPGSFTYRSPIKKWVWTTFHNYQWDLNYENPVVFNRMTEEMLFLANAGVEVLRLDAVAFLWKRVGTSCENLPEAHWVIRAFNALVQMVAPAMVFKSEAIVHPDEVNLYIDEEECQLSYNPQLMALLWNSLATRKADLLRSGLKKRFSIKGNCAWVNYARCHDDIGWSFSNEDLEELHFRPDDHRKFLSNFFTGRFDGSFARGMPFQEDPITGDMRVSGTCASLCGLEKAIEERNDNHVELAIRRILLLHGVLFTIGGVPLIYLGDELGVLNDYGYVEDAEKLGDSRWLHRPLFDWDKAEHRRDPTTVEGRIYMGLMRLAQIRRQNLAFTRAETEIIDTGNEHVLGYFRQHDGQSVLVLANFSESPQVVLGKRLRWLGVSKSFVDIISGRSITAAVQVELEAFQFMVVLWAH